MSDHAYKPEWGDGSPCSECMGRQEDHEVEMHVHEGGPPRGKTRLADPPSVLTFDRLRLANLTRLSHFPGHTISEIEEVGESLGGWTYNDWMVALVGEVGELANLLKKRRRGWVYPGGEAWSKEKAAKELADIQTYLDLLAACLDVDLGAVTTAKFNEVSERSGLPDRL